MLMTPRLGLNLQLKGGLKGIKPNAILFLVSMFAASIAHAQNNVPRSIDLLVGPDFLIQTKKINLIPGLRYNIGVTEKFSIGFLLAYRRFDANHQQLGYGTLLTHHFPQNKEDWGWLMEYGLLVTMNFKKGVAHSALAHDTRLAAGMFFKDWTATLGYHISALRYYDTAPENQNRVSLLLGYQVWTSLP